MASAEALVPPQTTAIDLVDHLLASTVHMDQTRNLNNLPAEVLDMICNYLPGNTNIYVYVGGSLQISRQGSLQVFQTRPSGRSVMRKVCKELRTKVLASQFLSVRAHKFVRIADIPDIICGEKIKVLNIEMIHPCNATQIVGDSIPLQVDFLLGCSPPEIHSQYPELDSLTFSMSGSSSSDFVEASQEFEVAIRSIIAQYSSATTVSVESTTRTIKIEATNMQG